MRVAVCVSGQCVSNNRNTSILRNNNRLKEHLGRFDFFYATWSSFEKVFSQNFPSQHCFVFEEPVINYHPYDIPERYWESNRFGNTKEFISAGGDKVWEWSRNHTKQLLIHAWLCRQLIREYDVIVRTRFDVWVYKYAELMPFIIDTFENNRINALTATKRNAFEKLNSFDTSIGGAHHQWLVDQLIIHPVGFINPDYVDYLNESGRLHPAEMGWYQILSKQNNSIHKSYDGWVNHDKNILTRHFYDGLLDVVSHRPLAVPSIFKENLVNIYGKIRSNF